MHPRREHTGLRERSSCRLAVSSRGGGVRIEPVGAVLTACEARPKVIACRRLAAQAGIADGGSAGRGRSRRKTVTWASVPE